MHLSDIPEDVIEKYNLKELATKTEWYLWRYKEECTTYRKWAYKHRNYSKSN
jgi:hypothetical protein